jgi:hypothetical protein
MDHRTEQMKRVASQIETIVKENGRRGDIAITYCEMDAESIADFTEWECERNELFIGHEYFLIWEVPDPFAIEPFHLLYAVNVSADSVLTAVAELMNLVCRKF